MALKKITEENKDQQNLLLNLLEDRKLLGIIINAIMETLSGHTQTKVQAVEPYMRDCPNKKFIKIAGSLNVQGDNYYANFLLGFTNESFLKIYENMFAEKATSISDQNQDLAGELLNIAFGVMDPELTKLGFRLTPSFPVVLTGKMLEEKLNELSSETIIVPFKSQEGEFYLEIFAAIQGEV